MTGPPFLRLESDLPRDPELHFGPGVGAAADLQRAADALRPFAHPGDAPVPVAARQHHLRIDTAAVVAHQHAELPRAVFELDFDVRRSRMAEGVDTAPPADSLDFVADDWLQRSRPAFDDHAVGGGADAHLLLDAGERLLPVLRRGALRPPAAGGGACLIAPH